MSQSFDFTSYNNIKRLSEDELAALWEEYLKDKTNKAARDTLIVQYIYLIRYVVGRVKVTLPATISIEDIAGYGVEGLINAIERYSPQKNTRFETYALIRIRGAILDRIRAQDFLPRSVRKKIKDIKAIQDENKLNPQEKAEEQNVKQELEKALKRLPERERIIMVLYYQENMTLKEIGETINMSESRVCQLHAQGIMKLKNLLSENRTTRLRQSIIA